jgi:peroxiredoxin
MSHRWKIGILATAAVVAGIILAEPWTQGRDPDVVRAVSELDGQWVGREAVPFELETLGGQTRSLSSYRGDVVFLNFWASFCKPCRKEMPSMDRLIRQYSDRGLSMVAISLDASKQDARGFLQEFLPNGRTAMDILWDPTGEVGNRYGTERIPETYLIDREGRIVARFVSEYDWTRPEVKRLIEAMLDG